MSLWNNFENWMQLATITGNYRTKTLDEFERDEADVYLWRARL